jgi:alginate O-acetyltransferase complex protein AlgI
LLESLPAFALPTLVLLFTPRDWPSWALMWSLAVALFAGLKWLTWRRCGVAGAPWWRHAGYLVAWPGLDADAFLSNSNDVLAARPAIGEWLIATANLLAGVLLHWFVFPHLVESYPLIAGWLGFAAILLVLHFGSFHLLGCAWRTIGVRAAPLMNNPIRSTSISEFWGRRWNTAFRDLTQKHLFRPLCQDGQARGALVIGFLFSGLVHDVVISVPASGGYGGPTLFFMIQALAMLIERSPSGKKIGLGRGWRGWLYTLVTLVGPAWLLFHPPFVTRVVVPFIQSLTSLSY